MFGGLTDYNNSVVLATNGDVGAGFVTETYDVGTLGTNDFWEHGAIGHGEETDMRHTFGVVNCLVNELLSSIQTSLITALQSPLGVALFSIQVVGNKLPFWFTAVLVVVDSSRRCRAARYTSLLGLGRVINCYTEVPEVPKEGALLGNSMVVLQGNSDCGADGFSVSNRRLDILLISSINK